MYCIGLFPGPQAELKQVLILCPGSYSYRQVTERDLWVEDPASPDYNRHLVVEGERPLDAWESGQRMRLGDPTHRLKRYVAHNGGERSPAAREGAGSAVFLHIWRDGALTAGCTAMPPEPLEALLRWLEPGAAPLYVLLPAPIYGKVQAAWGLPPLE